MLSPVLDDLGYDIWASFLHDSSNAGHSSTMINLKPKLLGKLQGMDKDDVFYGCIVNNNRAIASYTNKSSEISGVVAYDLDFEAILWSVELPERFCFTPPVLNPDNGDIFVASTNGYNIRGRSSSVIVCIDIESGDIEWENTVDGAVFGSLVYFDNLLFYQNFYRDHVDEATCSDPGDVVCLDAGKGSDKWIAQMSYSFPQTGDNNLFPAIFGQDILVPNTYVTYPENDSIRAGDICTLYSFDTSTGRKNWEIRKQNAMLPSVSVDSDMFYFTFTEKKGDNYTQKLEAYTSNRTLKWTYSISSSMGWCSVPIYNDSFIFLRNRSGSLYCIDKAKGKRVWKSSSGYNYRAGDGSIYAVNDHYVLTSFYSDETSYLKMFDLSRKTSRPIWEEEIQDSISQIALYKQTIVLVGKNTIYTYGGDTPELDIEPSSLSASLEENKSSKWEIAVSNEGKGELKGTLSTDTSWISVSPESFTNDTTITVTLNSRGLSVGNHRGSIEIASNGGDKTIPVSLTVFNSKQDTTPPILEIYSPWGDYIETEETEILIEGRTYDEETNIKSVTLNNEELTYIDLDGFFEYYYPLAVGDNVVTITATNDTDLATSKDFIVYRFDDDQDTIPPTINILSPLNDEVVYTDCVMVIGTVYDHESGIKTFTINNQEVQINDEGVFSSKVELRMGMNHIQLKARDNGDNITEESVTVYREKEEEDDEELIIIELRIGHMIALVNKEPLLLDTPPIIYNGRTMVPIRFIAETFGADVYYDSQEQEIDIAFGNLYISVWINKTRAKIEVTLENGKRENHYVNLDVPPIISNGRTLLPLRFISDVFGASIDWDGIERKITIQYVKGSVGKIPEDYLPPEDNLKGNSAGNINNKAIATLKEGWIYYRNDNDGYKIYKIRPDGSGRQKVNNDNSGCINLVDDWLYYYNLVDGYNIYKIRTDGTGRQKINNDESSNINVVGDWIYYCNHGDLSKIYKIRINGLQREKVNDEHSEYINVVGDWIYYVNVDDSGKIYKIRIDGTGQKKLNEDISHCINVSEDWIFYTHRDARKNNLYRIGTNGLNRERINNDRTSDINVVGNWVYFINESDGGKVYKIRSDGTERQKVNNDRSIYINVVGNWLYYCNEDDQRKIYRIDTDGNHRQRIQ